MGTRPLLAASALFVFAAPAAAQEPHLLGYQGRMLRADGTAATGTAAVVFSIHDAAAGGTALWTETQTLGLSDGYYATLLGLVSPLPDAAFDGSARWLELRVGSETLAPRQPIGTVPFALSAQNIRGGSASVSSLQVAGQTVIDAGGRLAGSARYSAGGGIVIDAAQTVLLQNCAPGQALVRDAAGWQCATAGTLTAVTATAPLGIAGASGAPAISIPRAAANASGYLASSDWSLFWASARPRRTACSPFRARTRRNCASPTPPTAPRRCGFRAREARRSGACTATGRRDPTGSASGSSGRANPSASPPMAAWA